MGQSGKLGYMGGKNVHEKKWGTSRKLGTLWNKCIFKKMGHIEWDKQVKQSKWSKLQCLMNEAQQGGGNVSKTIVNGGPNKRGG